MKALSILPGHGWRDGRWDPGAVSPAGWQEAELVRDVAMQVWRGLERQRRPAELLSAGSYGQRGHDADAGLGADLVLQLHADASPAEVGPDITRVFYWPTGTTAARAEALAIALASVVPWGIAVHAATASWPGPRSCLAAVGAPSLLVELGFTDGPLGRTQLPELVRDLGGALVRGLLQ